MLLIKGLCKSINFWAQNAKKPHFSATLCLRGNALHNPLKMEAPDGKRKLTDVADTEQLLRLIQSIPSPKAEPFKQWLAKVGY